METSLGINYLAILACGVAAMIIGFIWYGPLFGKLWRRVTNPSTDDLARREEMQRSAAPLYVLQFILVLLQAFVLTLAGVFETVGATILFYLIFWAGFIMPTVAAGCMWNNDSKQVSWTKFLLQSGYFLVCFVVFAVILTLMLV